MGEQGREEWAAQSVDYIPHGGELAGWDIGIEESGVRVRAYAENVETGERYRFESAHSHPSGQDVLSDDLPADIPPEARDFLAHAAHSEALNMERGKGVSIPVQRTGERVKDATASIRVVEDPMERLMGVQGKHANDVGRARAVDAEANAPGTQPDFLRDILDAGPGADRGKGKGGPGR